MLIYGCDVAAVLPHSDELMAFSSRGVFVLDSSATKILSNEMRRSGVVGTLILGQKSANAKVVGIDRWNSAWLTPPPLRNACSQSSSGS